MSRFNKEELVAKATEILEDEKDAYAIVNEFIPENDNHGDIDNFLKRFKCWQSLNELAAHIENPLDISLEKIHIAKEFMYKQLLELTKRTEKMQDIKDFENDADATLMKLIEKDKNTDKDE